MNNYHTKEELRTMGFRSLGERVLISRDARIFSPKTISIGDDVIIDAFTLLNGDISIGKHVHISSHCELFSGKNSYISMGDYSGLSSHTTLYGQTDDYVGAYLHNPTVSPRYRNITEQPIILEKYVLIATHAVVLPGVRLGEGCSFGANCLINKSTEPGGVYIGTPCRRIRERDLEEIRKLAKESEARERKSKERRMARNKTV